MKSLRYYQPGKIEVEEIPCPDIGQGEILVQVSACGICATDIKTYLRGHPKIQPGSVLGHEISGRIARANQVPEWRPGMRVAVAPYVPCYDCDQCALGNYSQCDHLMDVLVDPGGFAEFLRVPARIVKHGLFSLPDTLSMPEATLAEPLACCLHGLDALAVSPLDHLLIIGDGPMGLLQAEAARVFGVKQIILVGKIPERLERARKIADIVVDARDGDITEAIYRAAPGGANKILVSVGNGEVAKDALRYVHKGGAVNLFAGLAKGTSLCIDPAQIHYDEVRLIGSFGFAPSHFQKAIQWLAERKINTEGIITATVSLSEAKAAFQDVSAYHGIKTIVTFSEKDEDINPN